MKVYAITGPFVPTNEPMSLLPYKHLSCLDADIDVKAMHYHEDLGLKERLDNDSNISKFHVSILDEYNDALFSIKNVNLIKALNHTRKFINQCVRNFNNQDYDLLYSSAFPAFTHQAALKIKAKYPDKIWIASFSDPINNSPYKDDKETYQEYMWIEKAAFKVYSHFYVPDKVEIDVFNHANLLIFICEEQRDFMIEQYFKSNDIRLSRQELLNKSFIYPLTYIEEWNQKPQKSVKNEVKGKFVLSHFGRVYGLRKIDLFIDAIKELLDEYPLLRENLKIEQYGEFKKKYIKQIKTHGLDNIFVISEKISYQDCINKMKSSNALLIFDTILPENCWQPYLPSKVLEYSLLNKNVLALTTSKSPIYRIMKRNNGLCARYEIEDIKDKLIQLLEGKESKINYIYENKEIGYELNNKINDLFKKKGYNG